MSETRILGIDPGLRQTGFGVIDCNKNKYTYIASGVIKTNSDQLNLPERLKIIFDEVCETILKFNPKQMCIEKTFVNMNANSSLALGQARGVSMAAAIQHNLPIYEYTALQIKKYCRWERACSKNTGAVDGAKAFKFTRNAWSRFL